MSNRARLARSTLTAAALVFVTAACGGTTVTPAARSTVGATAATPAVSQTRRGEPHPSSQAAVLKAVTVEPADSPEGKAIAFFADEVAHRSGGTVTVDARSEAGENDQEQHRAGHGRDRPDGDRASRNWDDYGVTSLQALEAPFLITSDARAEAATTGDLAPDLMAGLAAKGVAGLALWPIDLRHPVYFDKPFLTPADMKDAKIRIVGSNVHRRRHPRPRR